MCDMFHKGHMRLMCSPSNHCVGVRLPCVVGAVDEVGLDEVRVKLRAKFVRYSASECAVAEILFADASSRPIIARHHHHHHRPPATGLNMATIKGKGKIYITRLVVIFCLWKILLLTLAAFCPGPGYDTSALILLDSSTNRHKNFHQRSRSDRLTLNLLRWDALYFVKAAERGKAHEQEWAFSWAYSKLLSFVGQCKWPVLLIRVIANGQADRTNSPKTDLQQYIVAGIVLSNISHLLSVIVLYRLLTITVGSPRSEQISFVGAVLHILTPASLFLSAPYTEAMFSLFNFTGMLLYVQSKLKAQARNSSVTEDAYRLGSGIFFAAATLMRSNGLLSGLVLLYDVGQYLPRIISMQLTVHDVRRIIVTCMAGGIVALGFVWPQYLAYTQFCTGDRSIDGPPWCRRVVPSIFTWVQSRYW
jgi:phosphatidylinositol glycan class V